MSDRPWTKGPWIAGHHTNPDIKCKCRTILSEGYAGGIATIEQRIDLPIGEGGNDAPPEQEAIANARLIAAAPELAEALMPFVKYLKAREARPLLGLGDAVHSIHMGTEFAAEITMDDIRAAREALKNAGWTGE